MCLHFRLIRRTCRAGEFPRLHRSCCPCGVIFYTLDQEQSSSPQIVRRDECLQCHVSGSTQGVPGFVVRSVYPDASGMPLFQAGGFITDHRSPFKERWGGWYVTGTHGSQTAWKLVFENTSTWEETGVRRLCRTD
jgi:hypothetical protein